MIDTLKLFKLETDTGPVYFNDRRRARYERDALRDAGQNGVNLLRGPDHRKGETFDDNSLPQG